MRFRRERKRRKVAERCLAAAEKRLGLSQVIIGYPYDLQQFADMFFFGPFKEISCTIHGSLRQQLFHMVSFAKERRTCVQGTALGRSPRLCGFCFHYSQGLLRSGFGPPAQWSRLCLTEVSEQKARNVGSRVTDGPCSSILPAWAE